MTERDRVEAAFDEALERVAVARSEFLEALRESEPAVAAQVEQLLMAHDVSEGILDNPAVAPAPPERRIGPYRVIRELGRGGMGVVYLAERDDGQFRRRVAVKLLRSTPEADELQARFVAERQILALLAHPNIAQLMDGGITDGRLPYLVMEYVEGLPITQYCERQRLTVPERLRLFQNVCGAIEHAHRNLVIHRDLKPSNILVTQDGQVKLLDFGIAKLLNPGLSDLIAPHTATLQRALTPEYASPEQLRGEPLSTTSDVYALGVILFELLTGRRPHEAGENGSPHELARRVCEEVAPRASDTGAGREIRRVLRGDIDAIVAMALRKEPLRRYGSAEIMAQDIQRYLDGMPVLAQKGSRAYHMRKFVRRHQFTVGGAVVVAASLVLGAGVALRQTATARNERDRAQQAAHEAEEVTGFLVAMFEANDPDRSRGQEATARDLMQRGLRRVEQLRGQPLLQARLLDVIGRVHNSLGEYPPARQLLERALSIRETQLGPYHLDVAETLTNLAESLRFLSLYPEAEAAAQRALDVRSRALGPNHPLVATSTLQVATMAVYRAETQRAIELTRQAIAIREAAFGPKHPSVADALVLMAGRLNRLGEYAEAERVIRRAIAIHRSLGVESAQLADALINLAYILDEVPGRAAEADTLYRQALQMRRNTLGVDSPMANWALGDIVLFLIDQRRFAEAVPLAQEHLAATTRIFGAENMRTSEAMLTYASALSGSGRRAEAVQIARNVVTMRDRVFGREHAWYAGALYDLALLLDADDRPAEAEPLVREAIAIRTRTAGRESGLVALSYAELSRVQSHMGRYHEASESVARAMRILQNQGVRPAQKDFQLALRQAVLIYERLAQKSEADRYRAMLVN